MHVTICPCRGMSRTGRGATSFLDRPRVIFLRQSLCLLGQTPGVRRLSWVYSKHEPWGRPLTKQVKWGQLLCCPHRLDTIQLRITTLDPVVAVVMLLLVFLDKCLIFLSHFSKVNVVYSCVGCRMSLCSVGYEKEEWIYLLLIQNGQSSCLLSIASKRVISAGLCWKLVTLSTSLRC